MNRVEIIGRVTKDIELRSTLNGKSVVSFTLAVDRKGKDAGTDFVPCVAWDKTADIMQRYVFKGFRLGVAGHLNTRTYEDKRKEKRFVMEVVVDELHFLDNRAETKAKEEETEADDDLPF